MSPGPTMFYCFYPVIVATLSCLLTVSNTAVNFSNVDIPKDHMPFYFHNFPDIAKQCLSDHECPFKDAVERNRCWGYERSCSKQYSYSSPDCNDSSKGLSKNKELVNRFYEQADFGYVRKRDREMQIMCEPLFKDDSSLECADHLRFCRGRNLMLNFTDLTKKKEPIRYAMDVLKHGQIGGYCKLHKKRLMDQCDHISPLQSWGPELRNFVELPHRPIENNICDVIVEKPTFILKIDASVNMYHHFCDFFNLYAALHLNSSHPDMFTRDVHILIWESYSYLSNFAPVMETFTQHPVWDLKTFRGDIVCFRNVVFPLLPRMIFGLFYNTPVVYGCEKSGLFHAFSKHILHRLRIPLHKREDDKIHVTLLSRQTKYRRILNENEILKRLEENPNYVVKKVSYSHQMPFVEQLEITHNSDIFIGMHGSGLTHLLFLPDWASVFELHNCEDENCYKDLARLRGIKYFTWEDPEKVFKEDEGHHPDMGAHAKFTNYHFDVDEVSAIVEKASNHVQKHPAFQQFISVKRESNHETLHNEL
ncbi:EGF domain-specific O-linked N-acetylglucosamine transferase [Frankliniella fusca]|uniref:EGF domain-specific O-linked N-acetylglucosamine transferase n=1 Tax=Frankliniella fusca TaxID=407009 RepID=A0AAE1GTH2_9NEOP|nr:EGF domain-specific O-linked N-acetylglucosamine transferase [Frankliniella fusca]